MELLIAYWWIPLPFLGIAMGMFGMYLDYRKLRIKELKAGKEHQQQIMELIEQNRALAERVAVLERLATDEGAVLSAEIRKLG